MTRDWSGPWVAHFRDGPRAGDVRHFAVGPIWRLVVVAPLPHVQRWFMAGGDGIPRKDTDPPWPGEVRYVLRSTRRHRDEAHAYYNVEQPT